MSTKPFEYRPPDEDGGRLRYLIAALGATVAYWAWCRWSDEGGRDEPVDPEGLERGHRPASDVPEGGVALFGAGLLLVLALIFAGVWVLMGLLERDGLERGVVTLTTSPRRPSLQSDPAVELMEVRSREDSLLSGYAWVNRQAGTVRIPIDRAMALYANRTSRATEPDTLHLITESGFVDRAAAVPPPSAPPYLGTSPEPTAVNAEIAEILNLIRTRSAEALEPDPRSNR